MKDARRTPGLPLTPPVNSPRPPADPAAQAFLDEALDRLLRAWAEGEDLGVDALAAARPDLRGELAELVAMAREAALLRPEVQPQVPGYQVLHELGRGGMGVVYAARQVGLDRVVALKVLPVASTDSERARRRFLAEARGLAKVQHPHVVAIFDVLEVGELCAYAMEWIDGKSLADLLDELAGWSRRGPAPPVAFGGPSSGQLPRDPVVWFCRLAIAIAQALDAVHRRGLVHRDVKPSNILLRSDGTPLLSDFGVVRDERAELTRSGQIVGTPLFAPPEQLAGRQDQVGPAADVFALGATLHLALCGAPPFAGSTAAELAASIEARARRPLTALGLPRDLDTIVGKCLEARPQDRYASAAAVADDLERLLALRPIAARPLGVLARMWRLLRRNRRSVVAAVCSAALVLVASVTIALHVWNRASAPARFGEHLRAAQGALLDPFYDEWVARERRGDGVPVDPKRTQRALVEYEVALGLMPQRDDVARERDVVALAHQILSGFSAARTGAQHSQVAPVSRLPQRLADDARLRGLYAFLLGDVSACTEAWADLDLAPSKPDPLIDAAAGQMHLARGDDGKAYPRLLHAFQVWPNADFLALAVADAAVRRGDLEKADQYLAEAARLGCKDESMICVRAELLAARGRVDDALDAYDSVNWHPGLAAQEHARLRFVELLGQVGDPVINRERALDMLLELVEFDADRTRHGGRLREVADAWWAALPQPRKEIELLQCWNNNHGAPLLRRLETTFGQLDEEESRRTTTPKLPGASPLVHRQHRSTSTLPLEFTMTQSRVHGWIRWAPLSLQQLAAAVVLASEGPQRQSLGKATPTGWRTARLGSVYGVAVLGFVLSALTPTPPAQVQWVNVSPAGAAPSNRIMMTGVFDAANGLVLAYGGYTYPGFHDDLWAWNGSQRTWSRLSPAAGLSSRYDAAISQESNNRLIIFGGHANGGSTTLADTWRWNGSAWSQLTPANSPPSRRGAAMAFDSHRGVAVLFGGISTVSGIMGDTWEWNGSNWSQMTPPSSPMARYQHAMTYDTVRQRVVLFGGEYNNTFLNDTYEWDGSSWLRRSVAVVPSPRKNARLIWDSDRSRAVLFGGVARTGGTVYDLNDLWEWDGSTWTQRTPAGPQIPGARYATLMVYDPIRRKTVMFGGGISNSNVHLGDTWILEPVAHADVTPTGPGCAGLAGPPTLAPAPGSMPWIGHTFSTEITGISTLFRIPLLVLGFSNPNTAGLLCRADCTLRVQLDLPFALASTNGQATWSVPIPNDPNLLGFNQLYTQVVVFNFATGCFDAMSNGLQLTIGAR